MKLPVKSREVQNFAMDSRRWNDFRFRDGDIVIATWARSGTTWLQQIVGQLLLGPSPALRIDEVSPWMESRHVPKGMTLLRLENQMHRRFVKTHLPLEALPYSPKAKYIFVGRDGRDAIFSMYAFHSNQTEVAYRLANAPPGLVGPRFAPPVDTFGEYFDDWLHRDGYPWWPFWSNIRSWWSFRHLPNILFVHFNDLKADLAGVIRDIASYLEIEPSASFDDIVKLCTFQAMTRNSSSAYSPAIHHLYTNGISSFIRKGEGGEWLGVLTPEQISAYENFALRELPIDCARWLEHGRSGS